MRNISASGLSMFRGCPKSFYYKYVEGLRRIDQTDTEQLQIGKIFHALLEGEKPEIELDFKTTLSIEASADFVKNGYRIQALEGKTLAEFDKNTKKEFELTEDGFIGFIDLVIEREDGDILVDYKYVASLDYANSYRLSDQTKLYPYLYQKQTGRKAAKFIYLCVVKPTIRLKKDEQPDQYFDRVVEWYGNEFTAKIGEVVIERDKLDDLEQELAQDLHFIRHMIDNEMYYRNTGNCIKYNTKCLYYPICYEEENWEIYYEVKEDR